MPIPSQGFTSQQAPFTAEPNFVLWMILIPFFGSVDGPAMPIMMALNVLNVTHASLPRLLKDDGAVASTMDLCCGKHHGSVLLDSS